MSFLYKDRDTHTHKKKVLKKPFVTTNWKNQVENYRLFQLKQSCDCAFMIWRKDSIV